MIFFGKKMFIERIWRKILIKKIPALRLGSSEDYGTLLVGLVIDAIKVNVVVRYLSLSSRSRCRVSSNLG